jgi:Prohead core protein serine protease
MALYLKEHLTFDRANMIVESVSEQGNDSMKTLYMKGIFIQGGVKNANERVYPVSEIENAVDTLNKQITEGYSVLGEVDHPDDLKINLDRVSHMITSMWMDGPNGFGKLKILPTPMGQLVKTMLESGVKLGVSSRGSGNVSDMDGRVSDFEIITVDIVAQPSAPNAYPKAIYESILNHRTGYRVLDAIKNGNLSTDKSLQSYVGKEIKTIIETLKLR